MPEEQIGPETDLLYLLDRTRYLLTRWIKLPADEYADAISLWVAHAHAVDAAVISPRLVLKSPEKSSGKSRTLEVLKRLVPAPVHTINASIAYIFRKLKDTQITLLFDETDTIFNARPGNENFALLGLLNAGWEKGATVGRIVGEGKKMRPEEFPVYAAVALALIGNLPDTLESRSIIIPMRRRAPDEPIEKFRQRKVLALTEPVRDGLAAWAEKYKDELTVLEPVMPAGLEDRLEDAWEPLIAIADMAGEPWASRGRKAAIRIGGGHVIDDASIGVQLLGDVRASFVTEDRISSITLLTKLNAMDEASWGGWHNGSGMTPRDLARRLKPFAVGSRPLRPAGGGAPFKGYLKADFDDAWRRYLPSPVATVSVVTELPELDSRNRVSPVTLRTGAEAKDNGSLPASAHGSDGDLFDEAYFADLAAAGGPSEDDE
jgi:hypothetical protein